MGNWYKWEEELIEKLSRQDQAFADMMERHHSLEKRLDELKAKSFLNAEEEALERSLKREKLAVRDQIEKILRNHKNVIVPA